jgi:hypothetical protein
VRINRPPWRSLARTLFNAKSIIIQKPAVLEASI